MERTSARRGLGSDTQSVAPTGKALVEGYRKDILNGFDREKPRYNPLNPDRPQSSPLVDLKDPIQVHLLTETALSDSRSYEILSQEEVDGLKKQMQSLAARIEQTKTNLAIQSKYRDAAISMAKLYSPGKPEGKRRSLLGNRSSGGESAREAELERQASERRCEELAAELFSLEKRIMEPQTRLLEHTAGILQMTHRVSTRQGTQATQANQNGIPGSPESLYTYSNDRNSLGLPADDNYFDDGGLDLQLDQKYGQQGAPRQKAIEIPIKSPIREQHNQLREEADRLKEENSRLKGMEERFVAQAQAAQQKSEEQLEKFSDSERRLEDLNRRLRDLVVKFNPSKDAEFGKPPPIGDSLLAQLTYLETGLAIAAEEQNLQARGAEDQRKSSEESVAEMAESVAKTEKAIETANRQLQEALQPLKALQQTVPESGAGLDRQLDYLQAALQMVYSELTRATQLSTSISANKQNNEQAEAVLMGLWDIIQSGYAGIAQQKAARRKTRIENGLEDDDDELSGDEPMNTDEVYSLAAFSTKVQWLYAQATSLKEQKSVLKRQIKQQRELNNKSGSEKDVEISQKTEQLKKAQDTTNDLQQQLDKALGALDLAQKSSAAAKLASDKALEGQMKEKDTKMASLESSKAEIQAELVAAGTKLSAIQAQLVEAGNARDAAKTLADELQKDMKEKDDELERMNVMVIELKTELTFAKAELDGAYGSRAERAAEAAALTKNSETAGLSAQVEKLKAELASTLKEFEDMTKETITAEKERLELEGKLDDAIAEKSRLDAEVIRLQEQLDAERLKIPASPSVAGSQPRAGASMLSEQFRATMKEERKKFQEELREEQAKRRKLEEELRAFKKTAGPGRSPLGPLSPR